MGSARPLVVCLQEVGVAADEAITWRCVAVPGKLDGLALGPDGAVRWREEPAGRIALGVTGDEQLGLWRPREAPAPTLSRAGRAFAVPEERVVIVLHDDELAIGAQRWRVLLHGPAQHVAPPKPLGLERALRRAATVGALGLATGLAACERAEQDPSNGTSAATANSGATSSDASDASVLAAPSNAGSAAAAPSGAVPIDAGTAPSARTSPSASHSAPSPATKAPPPANKPPLDVRVQPPFSG